MVPSLTELCARQDVTAAELQKLIVNDKKDRTSRKTVEYLKKKINAINTLWDEFESVDSDIRTHYAEQLDHPYFAKLFYDSIREKYEEVMKDIKTKMKEAKEIGAENVDPGSVSKTLADALKATASAAKDTSENNEKEINVTNPQSRAVNQVPQGDTVLKGLIKRQAFIMNMVRNSLTNLLQENTVRSKEYYAVKMKSIERHWENAQDLHTRIWEMIDESDDTSYDAEEYFRVEERVQEALIQLQERLTAEANSPTASQRNISSFNATMQGVHLPKIELPRFDGDYLQWRQFRDLFSELVHNQPISQCQKMFYLKTTLQGEAAKLIQHFTVAEANYETAWTVVNDRYENSRLLVSALINKLLAQSSAQSESAAAIKSLHDTTQDCLLSLENVGIDTSNWDPLILHLLLKKLDRSTLALWEQSLDQPKSLPALGDFMRFLERRFQSLEVFSPNSNQQSRNQGSSKSLTATSDTSTVTGCICCQGDDHRLFSCSKFLEMTPRLRLQLVQKFKHCVNCLKFGHRTERCFSRNCNKCQKKHNTLLHLDGNSNETTSSSAPQTADAANVPQTAALVPPLTTPDEPNGPGSTTDHPSALIVHSGRDGQRATILLSTILVKVTDCWGFNHECRALLDSGSHINFATGALIQKLGLQTTLDTFSFEGIGQRKQKSQGRVNLEISSRINNFSVRMETQILPKIVSSQPGYPIDISNWKIPKNVVLADPNFHLPGPIDLLIGVEVFYSTLAVGQIKLGDNLPILQNTAFGWTVSGRAPVESNSNNEGFCGVCSEDENLNQNIEKFWQLEEFEGHPAQLTTAERRCETHFAQTTKRDHDGRFIVRLPFQLDPNRLGESRDISLQRFWSIERKLSKDANLKAQYVQFMQDYQRLGHMKEFYPTNNTKPLYYLPHHCVLKPESTTTKLRVVFDASAKTSTNVSLNDVLAKGPSIQDDVFTLLLRFRFPRFAFTADIEKMYRQVLIHPDDQKYQLIWWREDPSHPLKCFQLTTVTYGTTSAPYLAVRCLHQLAEEGKHKYPLGSEALTNNFYVDDVLTGSDQLHIAMEMQSQLRDVLSSAGFNLRKWCANHPRLLQNIPLSDQELQLNFDDKSEENIKTMGLTWIPKTDTFSVRSSWTEQRRITKRTVSSDIARIYDPLGILSPVVILAKLFLQELWRLKSDWDAALPQELHTSWSRFREHLHTLNNIKFSRHIFNHRTPKDVQFHIFADASERAYGAAVYVRCVDKENGILIRLLCAKSRVAPTKQISLPRLELCAAKLATDLFQRIQQDLNLKHETVFLWTDSTAVLGWINAESSHYHTFVANRISAIQRKTIQSQWRHVSSEENPADLISRGVAPERLADQNLWFFGPPFLHRSDLSWINPSSQPEECSLEKRDKLKVVLTSALHIDTFIEEICCNNSFRRLQRILAYIMRFINKLKGNSANVVTSGPPTLEELERSLIIIVTDMQKHEFANDINQIKEHGQVSKNSSISNLTPFLDDNGVLRVGGRLQSSLLSYDAKHPILLPYKHSLTKMIISEIHKDNLHAGPQTLLSITRQRFWPLKGKILTRSVVQNCILCARARPKLLTQLMGGLPADRVQPARPFVNSGVDFCGPIYVHYKIRGKRPYKAYIAVFCCFASKAVHLELVSDLSTDAFIGALRRFTSRRGRCQRLYCDNATNFVGARNQLSELTQSIYSGTGQERITNECNNKGIEFKFIPPRAPHFGGLWEAAVKSAKHLLQTVLSAASLTYEETETVIVEAEAIMNSRPLTPTSADPNDLSALTPAHLLIGEPYTSSVDHYAQPLKVNLLTRWKMVSHIKNEFWRRWVNEYLNQLQHRLKWKQECHKIKRGMMVLVKEDNLPTMKWPLARVSDVFKGEDGLIRVVELRTANSIFKRPIHRLAPLPVETEDSTTSNDEETGLASQHSSPRHADTDNQPGTSTHNDDEQVQPKKKPRMSKLGAVMAVLITCLIAPTAYTAQVETTPFNSNPGIFFEGLGNANIITSDWKIIVYYNMETYWKEFQNLKMYSGFLERLCESTNDQPSCSRINSQVKHVIDELDENNQAFLSRNQTRHRRGAMNVVGAVANSLFGILDSQYADNMATTIDKIQHKEEHLSSLIHDQTSLLDATINVMKKDHIAIEQEFKRIDEYFRKTMENSNYGKANTAFTNVMMQTLLTITNLQRAQDALLDVLTDAHHGRIHLQLISPDQLNAELVRIRGNLPASVKLPFKDTDTLTLYHIMTIEGKMQSNYAVFILQIPLISTEELELFHLVPIPTLINGTFTAIQPSVSFLMVNLHRDQYTPITDQELSRCITIEPERHLCRQRHPLYKRGSTIAACEMDLLNHIKPESTCPIIKTGPGPYWIQLYSRNSWIYSLPEPITLNAVCVDKVTSVTIQGAGILKLRSDCMINQQLLVIQGHQVFPTITRTSYIPSVNLTDVMEHQQIHPARFHPSQYSPTIDMLDDIQQELSNLKTELPDSLIAHNVHHYALGYLSILLICAIVAYVAWKNRHDRVSRTSVEGTGTPLEPVGAEELENTNSYIIRIYDDQSS